MATAIPDRNDTALEPTEAHEATGVSVGGAPTIDAPGPGRYLAYEDAGTTRLVALEKAVTHLGRGFSVDVRIEDQSVSRRHAVIAARRDGARILDDRSANGTFVNGSPVSDAPLRDRDVIRLGRVVLVYLDVPA
jgi:pSer/pThr/pTyr-binding forkhead associated (FHA) protein